MCNKCYTIGDEVKELEGKACSVPDVKVLKTPEAEHSQSPIGPEAKGAPAVGETKQTETPEVAAAKQREHTLRQIRMVEKEMKRLELLKLVEQERLKLQALMAEKGKSILADACDSIDVPRLSRQP